MTSVLYQHSGFIHKSRGKQPNNNQSTAPALMSWKEPKTGQRINAAFKYSYEFNTYLWFNLASKEYLPPFFGTTPVVKRFTGSRNGFKLSQNINQKFAI